MVTETYLDGGINWNWYLTIEISGPDATDCKILKHWRVHKFNDANHPQTVGYFRCLETAQDDNGNTDWKNPERSKRIVNRVILERECNGFKREILTVTNPANTFSYI